MTSAIADHDARSAITSLMDDAVMMDTITVTTAGRREILATKLMGAAEQVDLTAEGLKGKSSKDIEARLGIVTAAANLLNDQDKAAMDKVKLKLKMDQSADDKDTTKIIHSFLQSISTKIEDREDTFDIESVEKKLDAAIKDNGIEVPETELRTDPSDLS